MLSLKSYLSKNIKNISSHSMVRSKLLDISSTIILIEANKYNQKSNKNIILTIGTLPVEFLILSVDKRLILPDRYY